MKKIDAILTIKLGRLRRVGHMARMGLEAIFKVVMTVAVRGSKEEGGQKEEDQIM